MINKILRVGLVSGALILAVTLSSKLALAQSYSQNSGNPSIVVDKKVRPINDTTFYDNIDPNVKVFNLNEQLEFLITVTNNSNQVLYNVEMKDYLPKYLSLLFYPGTYDSNRVITDEIGQMGIGETATFKIRASINDVPTTTYAKLNVLQVNKVCVGNNLTSDCDQAQYFIAAKNIPGTGADDLMVKTVVVLLSAVTAVGLRKLARGY